MIISSPLLFSIQGFYILSSSICAAEALQISEYGSSSTAFYNEFGVRRFIIITA